jgi:multiple sugar transport system ATP-binding protein
LRAELRVEIKRLHARLGATMIYVTHDQIEALTLADRIAVMQGGVIQQLDTPQKIYREPVNRFVASFVGSPAMNFITGKIDRSGNPVFVAGDLRSPLDGYRFNAGNAAGPAVLGIRPEHILTGRDAGPDAIPVAVEMVEPMGADTLVWCRVGSGLGFSVRMDGGASLKAGDTLPVSFPASAVSLFDDGPGSRL